MTRLPRSPAAVVLAAALALAAPASIALGATPPPDPGLSTAAVTPGTGPVSVAVVVPLTVPPTTTGLLGAETLGAYTAVDGLLTRELDAVAGSSVAIGIDPMIVASIRVLGSSAPATATQFLTRLADLSNETFLLQYADADPAVAALAGAEPELQPLGFDFTIDPGDFGPAVTPSPTPTTTSPLTGETDAPADPDAPPPLPTTDDLLAFPTTLPHIAWPAEGTLTGDGLSALVAQGYADVLVGGENAPALGTALVGFGDVDGLVIDDAVTDAVRDAAYAVTGTEYLAATTTLSAALHAHAITSPGRTVIAALDREWPFGEFRLSQVLGQIVADPSAQLVPLSDVLAGPRAAGNLPEPDSAGDPQVGMLAQLATATRDERGFLSIAEQAELITQPRRLALLGLSAVGWRGDEPAWQTASTALLDASTASLDSVQIVDGSDQLVLSDISKLRMQVSNALPVAVTVYLTLRPLRPLLHVEDPSIEVTIEPDSTNTVSVPVESITNGEVTVRAELHAASGTALGSARFFQVILQAGWETAGTLIAGALVVLIFGGGLVRTLLRRRREKAGAQTVQTATSTTESDD
jgi:hypothetical protein